MFSVIHALLAHISSPYRNILQLLEDSESKSRDPIYLYAVLAFAASMLKVILLSRHTAQPLTPICIHLD